MDWRQMKQAAIGRQGRYHVRMARHSYFLALISTRQTAHRNTVAFLCAIT